MIDFLATFRERHDCFTEMLELSNEQMALIESEDYSQLLAILGRKQRILGRLEEIHRLHPRLVPDWKAARDRLTPTHRATCDQLLRETELILNRLMAQEQSGTDRIAQRRIETRRELQSITDGARATSAYGQTRTAAGSRLLRVDQ